MRWKAKKHHTRLHIIKKNFLRLSVKISHKKRVLKRKAKIENISFKLNYIHNKLAE